uniref:Probable ATP-dependent transporter ycf16 n=1 Tax=Ahnfeltia plicata TaxID=28023 RepID=A0A1C9CAW4_9FLOR|nr:iron-sulfur cluster formation ABC transporter ATP-binding subunit [Ahnfeltia plicata]AOM65533.1 iron-sulfur cluster formation ABC transporter ATP-binding subunit [Ahnfeltia plicata]UAT97171.1 iron-sulfur cluster formation ABC transporter ATP-binding subunit [Ahnfeltia plicata]UAT97376.1 iron-sulfur cluster formation ABC transporter ATP-binding subunit [Ahnfeltia plicata]
MSHNILKINHLHANIGSIKILKDLNLSINSGEVHAIMGPNGSGKSTLAKVISGHPSYNITQGSIIFNGQDITYQEAEQRSHNGIFLAFQYPVEIPGVSNIDFLRLAYNSQRKYNNEPELDPLSFFNLISQKIKIVGMDSKFLTRNVNEGFSGGEKKRNEILQMALLNSKLSLLDETDSGLDIDALKTIANSINSLRDMNKAIVLITHYQRLLDYIIPDYIHIMQDGQIVRTGDANIAKQLEKHGYDLISKTSNH